jgi:hypothetical protein
MEKGQLAGELLELWGMRNFLFLLEERIIDKLK